MKFFTELKFLFERPFIQVIVKANFVNFHKSPFPAHLKNDKFWVIIHDSYPMDKTICWYNFEKFASILHGHFYSLIQGSDQTADTGSIKNNNNGRFGQKIVCRPKRNFVGSVRQKIVTFYKVFGTRQFLQLEI